MSEQDNTEPAVEETEAVADLPLEELYDTTSEVVEATVEADGAHVHVTWTGADGVARAVSGFVVPGVVEDEQADDE
jgi:hypothetical protein